MISCHNSFFVLFSENSTTFGLKFGKSQVISMRETGVSIMEFDLIKITENLSEHEKWIVTGLKQT